MGDIRSIRINMIQIRIRVRTWDVDSRTTGETRPYREGWIIVMQIVVWVSNKERGIVGEGKKKLDKSVGVFRDPRVNQIGQR